MTIEQKRFFKLGKMWLVCLESEDIVTPCDIVWQSCSHFKSIDSKQSHYTATKSIGICVITKLFFVKQVNK